MVLSIGLGVALISVEVWQLWRSRDATLRNTKAIATSLAESLSRQTETMLRTGDAILATLVQRVESEGVTPESRKRQYELMTSLASALPAIHEMGLTDKDGNALVKSLVPDPVGMNYRERDYFRVLSARDSRSVFIGAPVRSKVDGSINIPIARRINAKDGGFGGIVVASISMNFFRDLFEEVKLGSDGFIGLYDDLGVLLVCSAGSRGDGELTALTAAAGALEYRSPADQALRIGTFDRLTSYPMTTVVSQGSATALKEWYRYLRLHGLVVLCILIVIGVLGYRVDQANRVTRRQVRSDGLTGVANRRFFDVMIERELRRAARNQRPLSLILMDIDFFKSLNDRYGHPAGDASLRAIGEVLQRALRRPSDIAARYGGEEFAVLLPETDEAGAIHLVR